MNAISRLQEYVIALNLPIFPESVAEKFRKHFVGIIQKSDPNITVENVQIPIKEGSSQGYAFIKCKDPSSAKNLILTADYCMLDKKNMARLISPDQFKTYLNQDHKITALELAPPPKNKQYFSWFMVDERLFDQIVFSVNKLPQAAWFNHTSANIEDIPLPNYIQQVDDFLFSPDGSFFVTKTGNKINTYCGENWMHFSTVEYPNLKKYFYSPSGRFMIFRGDNGCDHDNIYKPTGAAVYDMLTGSPILKLCVDRPQQDKLKFAADRPPKNISKFIEDRQFQENPKFGANDILLFQSTEMKVYFPPNYQKSKSIDYTFDQFEPSLTADIMFTFRKQAGPAPPRIAFFTTDTLEQLFSQTLYNATAVYCVWHPNVPLCAVVVKTKAKKHERTSMVVYDLQNPKSVLTYNIQDMKGTILSCAWDPIKNEQKVTTIVEENDSRQIRVFQITKNINQISAYATSGTDINYSPSGQFAVVDDISNGNLIVQFYDMESGIIKILEIDGIESIEWDPSGVFLLMSSKMSGFSIWLLDGNKVINKKLQGFKKCLWRPKAMRLEDADIEAVKDKLDEAVKKYGRFGAVDAKLIEEENKQQKAKQMQKWLNFQDKGKAYATYQVTKKPDEVEFKLKYTPET